MGQTFILGLLFAVWFAAIYGTAEWITSLRTERVRIHLESELALPFVPAMLVVYMSIYPLFWLGPFVLRTRRELRACVASMGLITLGGGIGFLLLPADLAFSTPDVPSRWAWLYHVADELNLRYNLVPSLHVALAIFCVDVFARRAAVIGRITVWTWGIAIAVSTVLTYQHHVIDVVTGVALAMVVSRAVYPRWAGTSGTEV